MIGTPSSGWLAATWTGYKPPPVSLVKKPPPPPKPVDLKKSYRAGTPEAPLYTAPPPPVPRFHLEEVIPDAA